MKMDMKTDPHGVGEEKSRVYIIIDGTAVCPSR